MTKEQVAALRLLLLWLVGSDDTTVPPELMRAVHDLTPGSEYIEVPGSGHSVYFEDAPAFNEHVLSFLTKHTG